MALFDRSQLARARNASSKSTNQRGGDEERPSAVYWMNIGYYVTDENGEFVLDPKTGERVFVSFRKGVPLDDQDLFELTMKDPNFRALREAQNNVMQEAHDFSKTMSPGEEVDMRETFPHLELTVQLRMRNEKVEFAPSKPGQNPYIKTKPKA